MNTAYTPGPWRVIEANLLPYHGDHVADMSNGLMVVASSKLGDPLADARLIAAAPCLLEALQDMVQGDKEAIDDAEACGIPFPAELLEGYKKARAAIAKATGCAA